MSFWSMSRAGKDAQGQLSEMPKWYKDSFTKDLGRSNDLYDTSRGATNEYTAYLRDRMANGFATPEEIQQAGQAMLPGVDDAISSRRGRLNDIGASFDPRTGQVLDEVNGRIDEYGGAIQGTFGAAEGDTGDTFNRMRGRNEGISNDITGVMRGAYEGSAANAAGTYGGLRGANSRMAQDFYDSTGNTYDLATKNLEQLRPNGEFAAARTSRAFSPLVASTQRRLRAAGVDANSPEASVQLTRVGAARARAMDDQYADANTEFVDRSNSMLFGKQGDMERLRRSEFGTEADLATQQDAIDRGLRLGESSAFGAEKSRLNNLQNSADAGQFSANQYNRDQNFNRTADYLNQRTNAALMGRDMNLQDWNTRSNLAREQNQEDLTGLNLKDFQNQRGVEQTGRNIDQRNQAAGGLGQQGNQFMNNAQGWGNQAMGWGNGAQQGFQNAYGVESQNAGWGKKLVAGAAAAGADMFLPGSGQLIRGAAGGGQGGGQYGGGYQGGGVFSFGNIQNPFKRKTYSPGPGDYGDY